MKKENELLTTYINNVLHHPEEAFLDLSALPEEYRALGESLRQLGNWATEANRYAAEVARGTQDEISPPDENNVFAKNIRSIQVVLRHMTKQIEQIVDQNQAELPDVAAVPHHDFDRMVRELRKRTSALENERNLFIQFTESASERIVVLDEESGDILFGNKVAREYLELTQGYVDDAISLNEQSGCSFQNPYSKWTHTVTHPEADGQTVTEYFQVHSIYIIWENRGAIAHMFSNITELQKIHNQAITDGLTGVFNRSYSMEYLNRIFGAGKQFAIGFVDVDYLKYCNDTFGHNAGDAYLLQVTHLLKNLAPGAVVCRTGGDEFLVISETMTEETLATRLEHARGILGQERFDDSRPIRKSFSYGIAACTDPAATSLQKLLSLADERMYQNKLKNKKQNHLAVSDDRLT